MYLNLKTVWYCSDSLWCRRILPYFIYFISVTDFSSPKWNVNRNPSFVRWWWTWFCLCSLNHFRHKTPRIFRLCDVVDFKRIWKRTYKPVKVINKKVSSCVVNHMNSLCALQCINVRVWEVCVVCFSTNNGKSPEPTTGCGACGFVKEAWNTFILYLGMLKYCVWFGNAFILKIALSSTIPCIHTYSHDDKVNQDGNVEHIWSIFIAAFLFLNEMNERTNNLFGYERTTYDTRIKAKIVECWSWQYSANKTNKLHLDRKFSMILYDIVSELSTFTYYWFTQRCCDVMIFVTI